MLEDQIALLQRKLESAERDVDRAQDEVDWLRDEPIMLEPSALEEIERVGRMIPYTWLPTKGQFPVSTYRVEILMDDSLARGLFTDVQALFVGKKEEHIREDEEAQRAHTARIQKLQDEALVRAREQRDHQRKLECSLQLL